jgi:hypothetical protein
MDLSEDLEKGRNYVKLWGWIMRNLQELDISTAMSNNLQAELAQPQLQKGVRAKCSTGCFS